MAEIIRMPRLSDTMEEGTIISWLKKEGDRVETGDLLAEVETDKATMEMDSPADGVLLHIAVKEGTVPVDSIIAIIGEEGEDWKAVLAKAEKENTTAAPAPAAPQEAHSEEPQPAAGVSAQPAPAVMVEETLPAGGNGRIKASPLARSMAKELGIDLHLIQGSGPGGRVIKRDVENFRQRPAATTAGVAAPAETYTDLPLSQMRKTIARRLSESKFTAPHFYLTMEIMMDKVRALRKEINAISEEKISFNDFVIKAVALALRQHPEVNASWLDDRIRRYHYVHIGVAVAVEEGLMVPVLRHADHLGLSQIHTSVKDLAVRARERKLALEEMQGNTFTISNLGMFGIEEFTAIINPPDACILAVGGIMEKPVVRDGQIVPGYPMKVTLSCDHRVVDGATGAAFLQTLKQLLEEPLRLLVV
ncbi:MAG TPA: pyruvate dehydrogenase complex dihydrolipoamide acetyltransferase [Phaeodactylibacter sp.]|nr:pyruvate dehydrogenase complex dihydrolipoamide acetyltransferase [Phaeodactylibacter sp.]